MVSGKACVGVGEEHIIPDSEDIQHASFVLLQTLQQVLEVALKLGMPFDSSVETTILQEIILRWSPTGLSITAMAPGVIWVRPQSLYIVSLRALFIGCP